MKTVLCYGDSNTWGAKPLVKLGEVGRFGLHERWPGVLRDQLGADYWVIEEGLNGRTTIHDDPYEPHRNGKTYLMPCLLTHAPLDLVILKLGTNDLKHRFGLSAYDIATGAGVLVDTIQRSQCGPEGGAPKVLLICPPVIKEIGIFADMFEGGAAKSQHLADYYRQVAKQMQCEFFNAGAVIQVSEEEGIHYEANTHQKLGETVAARVKDILG